MLLLSFNKHLATDTYTWFSISSTLPNSMFHFPDKTVPLFELFIKWYYCINVSAKLMFIFVFLIETL